MTASSPWPHSALNIFKNVRVVPKYTNCFPFQRIITYLHVVVLCCMLVSTLKMESSSSSATIVPALQTAWRHIIKGIEMSACVRSRSTSRNTGDASFRGYSKYRVIHDIRTLLQEIITKFFMIKKRPYTVMRRITKLRSTTERIYDSGPIILYYNIVLQLPTVFSTVTGCTGL